MANKAKKMFIVRFLKKIKKKWDKYWKKWEEFEKKMTPEERFYFYHNNFWDNL